MVLYRANKWPIGQSLWFQFRGRAFAAGVDRLRGEVAIFVHHTRRQLAIQDRESTEGAIVYKYLSVRSSDSSISPALQTPYHGLNLFTLVTFVRSTRP